ncbi:thyroid receptor-interacting protein 11-like isoform X2 [Littorina saxatilis]|uniref:GRIP domain-containing protein n=1 Tax=Littorina saxatilis TaxID=31220 RepID=A0AAN9BFM7_9CAEN
MAWLSRSLGDSVSSLTGQLSNLTKDILTEGTEEVSDHATELSLANEQIASLESIQASQKTEIERLKVANRELEEKAESSELQINSISREYRTLLQEKETEINTLKQRHHELLEHSAKGALHSQGDTTHADSLGTADVQSYQEEGFEGWSNESWGEFDDSLRLQREINNLRQEVTRLRADGQHWRSVAAQLSQQGGQNVDQTAQHDILDLQAKIKDLEKTVAESRDQAQHEVVSLQDVHQNKMAALKKRHKDETTQLKSQISSLEQQLADARDGDSTGARGSSHVLPESERAESEMERTLRSELLALTQERDKIQTAKTHLEGELQELQGEVEALQTQRDAQQAKLQELQQDLQKDREKHQQQIQALEAQLEEAERWRQEAEQSRQQETRLKSGIVETGTQLQQVSADTETLIEHLGGEEAQQKAAAVLDSLEQENLVLKEQSLKQQEQITLLEKRLASLQTEWQDSRATITSLKQQLKQQPGETGSDSDNTLNQSLTTVSDAKSRSAASLATDDDDDTMDWQIQKEALEDVMAQLRQEIRDKDEKISLLSSHGVQESGQDTDSLREENERLKSELSSVREELSSLQGEREELETSISELDEQHEEATNHLITARNALQSQLADSQQQVKSLQQELLSLSQQQNTLEATPADKAPTSEETGCLKQELQDTKKEVQALKQQAETRETEMADLKVKLQKGTLALNDLHMDKKDFEEELAKKQEEVKAKVANIKTLREEKAKLVEENKDLTQRVHELEEEVDAWEQRNEDSQTGKGLEKLQEEAKTLEVEVSRLQAEVTDLEKENSAQRQKLDNMFTELDESRTLCHRLQLERETLDLQLAQLRDVAEEREKAWERVAELEMQNTAASLLKEEEESSSSSERVQELEARLDEYQLQLHSLSEENSALQEEVQGLKQLLPGEDITDIPDLKLHTQHIVKALQRRNTALTKMKRDIGAWSRSFSQPKPDLASGLPQSKASKSQSVLFLELCSENRTLVEAVMSGKSVLEEIQQQYHSGSPVCAAPLTRSISSRDSHYDFIQGENERLAGQVADDQSEISKLKQLLYDLEQESSVSEEFMESVTEEVFKLETVISGKDNELEMLQTENTQLMAVCEESKSRLADSEAMIESLKCELQSLEDAMQKLQGELVRHTLSHSAKEEHSHSQLEEELDSARGTIQQLERQLSDAQEGLENQKAGIMDLNDKCAEQSRALKTEQDKNSNLENTMALLRLNSVTAEEELGALKAKLDRAVGYLTLQQRRIVLEGAPASPTIALLALEYHEKPAIEMKSDIKIDEGLLQNGEIEDPKEESKLSEQYKDLVRQLQEKEDMVADLQQNNTTLVQMLEAKSLTSGDGTQGDVHRLQSEVKALRVEKEQMLAVMNDKSREASSLKAEVMRLMSVISAEKTALDKLQRDNQELQSSRPSPPRDDASLEDMTREAMHNLSRLVRDREVEIEALKQKNETLMAVLQDMSQEGGGATPGGATPGANFAWLTDKENLEKQLATLQGEREQMVAFVNQKHSESVAYHTEIQRLTALMVEENQRLKQLQADYDSLRPQFEDKNQSLLKAQNDLINYRQKYSELEVKYGELLQKFNASETVDAASFREVEEEKHRLVNNQAEFQQTIQERDEKLRAVTEKLNETDEALKAKDSEASALKKQVDSLHFQLKSLQNDAADLRQEHHSAEQNQQESQSQSQMLRDLNNKLTLAVREKEFEVTSLQERVQKLTVLVSEQQGEKTQVTQLLRDQEATSSTVSRLQQEVDQLTLALKQKNQQLNDLHAENLRLKEKEQKLTRELERLRGHLLQIEEGYTREALEAEEREKTLRNRLADAEEQLVSSASRVHSASQQATQHVESLQQQLHNVASQRDAAYMQVASLQDQCQQYAASLSNLQLVLEQFQREKESQVASETEHYQEEARQLREKMVRLHKELEQTKMDLEEASDGLEAASRLSEQLDRKEEALLAMREEVQRREDALKSAEEEIHKLTSSKDAKVDRELMKNLLLGYFHTPDRNRLDAIHAIGSVLGFTQDDFHKIDEGQGGGWVTSLFRRARTPGTTPPTTPTRHPRGPNQSFSQMFVKFLEMESTPPPAPARMPVEQMARETQQRHPVKERDPRDKPAFNPFTAPRHVSMPINVGAAAVATSSSSSSHLLMSPPSPGSPTTTFPVFSPFTSVSASQGRSSTPQNSSAILKDVLGSR